MYSGESFDFNIGQQYLRARFYDATTGRFNRLDPFFGNSSDPQSFHKYGYVHNDPISMIDPTGEFGIAGLIGSFSIRTAGYGALTGAIVGSLSSGIDKYLESGELDEAIVSGVFGGAVGGLLGAVGGGFAGALSQLSIKTAATFLKLAIVGNIVGTTYGVATSSNLSQAGFRGSLGVFGTISSITGLRLLQSVSDDLIRMMQRFAWDSERNAWKLVQGLGGFRLERFYGRTATPAKIDGVDFVIGSSLIGKKIQLKGPFLNESFQPLGRSPQQIANDLNPKIRNNTAADEFVIDTLGLTDSEAAELQRLIVAGAKKVIFLRNR